MVTTRGTRRPARSMERAPIRRSIPARTSAATVRRRAALGQPGHAVRDVSGGDGEVSVRFEAVYRRAEPAAGERRLLLAVLEDGIRTFLKHARATHGRPANLRREALLWLTSSDRRDPFAFETLCETLGIDAGRLRERALAEGGGERRLTSAR
jgi:hypothetical protein